MFRLLTVVTMALAFVPLGLVVRAQTPPPAGISIQWDTNHSAVRVTGLSRAAADKFGSATAEEQGRIFRVTVEAPNALAAINLPALSGKYVSGKNGVEFRAQYPFEPGMTYRATFASVSSVLRVPRPTTEPSTVVTQIYPTAEVLPQNLLKFYLHFSASMSGGHIYEHIHLTEEDGTPVELPFLEIDEELWNPEMTRLTLFLDPGRIKREVRPLEEIGPALSPGKKYILTISDGWIDARGTQLKSPFSKKFAVSPPDRMPPDPQAWKITAPKSNSREPLRIAFGKSMDQALALRMISVDGVSGRKSLGHLESEWLFEPAEPWGPKEHTILVRTTIEDLAGNNIGKPFEVDLQEGNQPREPSRTIHLPFRPH
jgi:hypothetical protein